jgi:hypothetical protein
MSTWRTPDGLIECLGVSKSARGHYLWKGAEILSPAHEVTDDRIYEELERMLPHCYAAGARVVPKGQATLHVHVDVSDVSFVELKSWLPKILEVQQLFAEVQDPTYRQLPMLSESFVEKLMPLNETEFLQAWFTHRGKVRNGDTWAVRRVIDVTPAIDETKRFSTVEFRTFPARLDAEYVRVCCLICVCLIQAWKENRQLDISAAMGYVKKMHKALPVEFTPA